MNDINSHIEFWTSYKYEIYVGQYKGACGEISRQLKERFDILIADCFSPDYLKKILRKHGISNSFIRENNKAVSILKKNYKRTININTPISNEERSRKLTYLKERYSHYSKIREDILFKEQQIKDKQQILPEVCELYKKSLKKRS